MTTSNRTRVHAPTQIGVHFARMKCKRRPARSMFRWLVLIGSPPLNMKSTPDVLASRMRRRSSATWSPCRRNAGAVAEVREIADAIMHIERRRRGRAGFHSCQIERPARLIAPRANVGLELSLVLFRDAPSRHIGVEVALHRIGASDALDIDVSVGGNGRIGFTDQRCMEPPIGKTRTASALVPTRCRTCPAPARTSVLLRVRGTSPRAARYVRSCPGRSPTTRVNEGRNCDASATADLSIQRYAMPMGLPGMRSSTRMREIV